MVQNLNNNLITAPELAELRKRLRNLETRVRDFVKLFKSMLTTSRMAKRSLLLYLDHGVIMLLLPFRSASLHRRTNKHITSSRRC